GGLDEVVRPGGIIIRHDILLRQIYVKRPGSQSAGEPPYKFGYTLAILQALCHAEEVHSCECWPRFTACIPESPVMINVRGPTRRRMFDPRARRMYHIVQRWGGYAGEPYGEGPELVVQFGA